MKKSPERGREREKKNYCINGTTNKQSIQIHKVFS